MASTDIALPLPTPFGQCFSNACGSPLTPGPTQLHTIAQPKDDNSARPGDFTLGAQAELELELSLRGSLLVQQQRRIAQLEEELQRAWGEIEHIRAHVSAADRDRQRYADDSAAKAPRYWTAEEHRLFTEGVARYGWKDVKSISQFVGTRNPTQVRTHAQKLFLRQQKERVGDMAPAKQSRTDLLPLMSDMDNGLSQEQMLSLGGGLDGSTIGVGDDVLSV